MDRGSSFLLQKDYRVHIPGVKELLKLRYDLLMGLHCIAFREESNQRLLQEINLFISEYYDRIRNEIKVYEI